MITFIKHMGLALLFAIAPALAPAQDQPRASVTTESAKIAFEAKTGLRAETIQRSPVPGFFEVSVGRSIYYMDETARWLFDGHLVDLTTKRSVTAARLREISAATPLEPRMDWKSLNLSDAIKQVHGKPARGRVLVIFEDPNCAHCKRLSKELDGLQDLTVFILPVAVLGPASELKNQEIWCSANRGLAWSAAMAGSASTPGRSDCDLAALARNAELANRLGVKGTPQIFFADGSRAVGFHSAKAIEDRLNSLAGQKIN